MITPELHEIYEIELCSGERRLWQYHGTDRHGGIWWSDVETGREFSESNLMYSWQIITKRDDLPTADQGETMNRTESINVNDLIVEQMADAMIYSDNEGMICGWNAAAESLFGYAKEEAIGQSLDLIIPERLREAHWAGFNRAMASGATRLAGRATITRSLTRSKGTIYVEMSFAVVTDGSGVSIGSVAVARDATQRYQNERALRERLEALEKQNSGSD